MRHITPQHMLALTEELSKEAGVMDYVRRARGALGKVPGVSRAVGALGGNQYGRQMMLGAGLGGVAGAATADEGQGVRGALRGAALGGGIAGARILSTKAGREAAKKGLSNFGQRQRYSLTGRGVDDVSKAREIGLVPKAVDVAKMRAGGASQSAIGKALKEQKLHEEAFRKGYLSAPGAVHGLLSKPGDVLKSGWQRAGLVGKGFAGLGAYETVKGLAEKPEPGGPGRLEKGLRGAGSTVGWLVAPGTLLGGHLVGSGAGWAGGKVGKAGDVAARAARGRVVPPQQYGAQQ